MTDIVNQSEVDLTSEKAKLAVKNFRAMQSGLTSYARAISRNKNIVVELATGGARTDGNKIYYRPPIKLGDMRKHERQLCDRRDTETKLQLCEACRVREEVLISIYHEIAHIAYGTFEKVTNYHKAEIMQRATVEHGSKYAEKIRETVFSGRWSERTYLDYASLISPYLPTLINALEDCRVDNSMFYARTGTKVMFDALMNNTFKSGVELDDGSRVMWNTRPLNSQILVGVFAAACKYDYTGWFSDEVINALADEELNKLIRRIDKVKTVSGVYEISFPILVRLRELGFCLNPDEQKDESNKSDESSEPDENQEPEEQDSNDEEQPKEFDSDSNEPEEESDSDSNESEEQSESEKPEEESDSNESEEEESDEFGNESEEESDSNESEEESDESGNEPEEESDGKSDESDAGDESNSNPEEKGSSEDNEGASSDYGESEESEDSSSPNESNNSSDESSESTEQGNNGESDESDERDPMDGDKESDRSDSDNQSSPVPGNEEEIDNEEESSSGQDSEEEQSSDPENSEISEPEESELSDDRDFEGQQGTNASNDSRLPEESDELDQLNETKELEEPEPEETNPLDSGADDGIGGVRVDQREGRVENYGDPEEVIEDFILFTGHDDNSKSEDSVEEIAAMNKSIAQGLYFETPSINVETVRIHQYSSPIKNSKGVYESLAWRKLDPEYSKNSSVLRAVGIDCDLDVPENILGPSLLEMRKIFDENKRADFQRNLKSGRINTKSLGKRAWASDPRLFQKKRLPGKRSYSVLIGIDISGSTVGVNIALAKRAAMAQAELCSRMGIDFAVYGHTANVNYEDNFLLDIYEIKRFDQQWSPETKSALSDIGSDNGNLDGHSIEYYRKIIEKSDATDKIILYYSDGKMPASNYDEELEILKREIRICKQKQISLMGVGIRTDSPRRHGLDTVQVNTDEDLVNVIRHLEKVLIRTAR